MKSLMLLWQVVLIEMGTWCCTSTTLDSKTAERRFKHEGLSFFTIVLPDFGKGFQKSLDQKSLDHDLFKGFAFGGGLPLFLGGFLDLVFDRGTGLLRPDPSIDAIFAIRQLTLMMGKTEFECSDARKFNAMKGYVRNEQYVKESDASRTTQEIEEFRKMSLLLWTEVFQVFNKELYTGLLLPKHGPGATADGLMGNQKFKQREWTRRMEHMFPALEYVLPSHRHYKRLFRVNILEPGAERPVKVITVPKTLKTPRIIAMEPTCMQYMQQAVQMRLREMIDRDDILSSFIGFREQDPNRILARKGSLSGDLATLDLSDASDLVSNQLVRDLVVQFPQIAEALDVTRSRKADVDSFGVIRLAKYASMGSALCFPIEAMVFLTIVFIGIQDCLSRPLTKKDLISFMGQVRVYGDDIIVPVDFVHSVCHRLATFGLRVNVNKSFWTGKFRESCGGDFYDGDDITVVRVRRNLPTTRKDVDDLISAVSLRNQFYMLGMWQTARYLDNLLVRIIPFPMVGERSPVLGRVSFLGFETQRIHSTLHKPLVKGLVVKAQIPHNSVDDLGALLKGFLNSSELPFADRRHLTRSGRPRVVNTKLGWFPAA